MAQPDSPSKKRARLSSGGKEIAVYTGEEGSLAHIAATQFFRNYKGADLNGVGTFPEAFKAVQDGSAMFGVIPIENSASGSIHCTYDLALEHDVEIAGELGVREVYCLCAKENLNIPGVANLASHANVLEACSTFIKTRLAGSLETRACRSTTDAARRVAEGTDIGPKAAAIATREAAKRFGLQILAEDIANDKFLETRYILIHKRGALKADKPVPFPLDTPCPMKKRSGCFCLRNEPGAMWKLLGCFAMRNVDILKVESRPIASDHTKIVGLPPGTARLWAYFFFVDYAVVPGENPEAQQRLQESLKEFSLWYKDFGIYPSHISVKEKEAQTWDEMLDIMAKA